MIAAQTVSRRDATIRSKIGQDVRVWAEDGIMYYWFANELTLERIQDAERLALVVIAANNIKLVPVIADTTNVTKIRLSMADLGRMFMQRTHLEDHASAIWVVGAKGKLHNIVKIVSKLFMNGRLQEAATLEDAKRLAHATVATQPLIDQE